jgi:hypothetical protein
MMQIVKSIFSIGKCNDKSIEKSNENKLDFFLLGYASENG